MPQKASQGQGVAQAIKVQEQGTVLWSVLNEPGILRTVKIPALYIPDAKVNLLSINSLGDFYPEQTVTFHPQGATMTGVPGDPKRRRINIIEAIRCQSHTPMSMEEPTRHPITWPTLCQPFITPISTSVQPKRNFYDDTTDWATWASRKSNFS